MILIVVRTRIAIIVYSGPGFRISGSGFSCCKGFRMATPKPIYYNRNTSNDSKYARVVIVVMVIILQILMIIVTTTRTITTTNNTEHINYSNTTDFLMMALRLCLLCVTSLLTYRFHTKGVLISTPPTLYSAQKNHLQDRLALYPFQVFLQHPPTGAPPVRHRLPTCVCSRWQETAEELMEVTFANIEKPSRP